MVLAIVGGIFMRPVMRYTARMKSTAASVTEYLASLPEERRAAVAAVRSVILKNLDKDYEERMLWGVAAYTVPQRVYPPGHHTDPDKPLMMCGVSSQKNDMVVYLMNVFGGGGGLGGDPTLREWFEEAWAKAGRQLCVSGAGGGGCCIRFKKLEEIAVDVIGESIRRTPARAFVERYVTMLAGRGKGPGAAGGKKAKPAGERKKPVRKAVAKKKRSKKAKG